MKRLVLVADLLISLDVRRKADPMQLQIGEIFELLAQLRKPGCRMTRGPVSQTSVWHQMYWILSKNCNLHRGCFIGRSNGLFVCAANENVPSLGAPRLPVRKVLIG